MELMIYKVSSGEKAASVRVISGALNCNAEYATSVKEM